MPKRTKRRDTGRIAQERVNQVAEKNASARGYGLSPRDVKQLKAEVEQRGGGKRIYVPNPHSKGFYRFFIETLKLLGVNRAHPEAVVVAKFRELTNAPEVAGSKGQTFWKQWRKGDDGVGPWRERFPYNAGVLQRVPRSGTRNNTPYGLKLLEVGTKVLGTRGVVIDILRDRDGLRKYRLNTDSDTPINQFRTRREDSRRATVKRFTSDARLKQKGKCAICDRSNRPLCVDHCHRHNHLRGLLCGPHNSGLGFFEDSPELLLRAALYLMATGKARSRKSEGTR
jgi:hypothetical protein